MRGLEYPNTILEFIKKEIEEEVARRMEGSYSALFINGESVDVDTLTYFDGCITFNVDGPIFFGDTQENGIILSGDDATDWLMANPDKYNADQHKGILSDDELKNLGKDGE